MITDNSRQKEVLRAKQRESSGGHDLPMGQRDLRKVTSLFCLPVELLKNRARSIC